MISTLSKYAVEHVSPAPGIDLYLGDCRTMLESLLWELPVEEHRQVDMVLTDPPYGIGYRSTKGETIANDKEPPLWCIDQMESLMRDNTPMYIWTRDDVVYPWGEKMMESGLRMGTTIIWLKGNGSIGNTKAHHNRDYEMVLVGHRGMAPFREWTDAGGRLTLHHKPKEEQVDKVIKRDWSTWHYPRPHAGKDVTRHPTAKPPEVMERAILSHTDPDALVLDPFMGGSPVGVACVRQGRRYIGIELNPKYFQMAVDNVTAAVTERDNDW